jgi:S1-C subfamily serine protease
MADNNQTISMIDRLISRLASARMRSTGSWTRLWDARCWCMVALCAVLLAGAACSSKLSGRDLARLKGSVVRISIRDTLGSVTTIGTGFYVAGESRGDDGARVRKVLTNCHVVRDPGSIWVVHEDGSSAPASVLLADSMSDIAVLTVESRGVRRPPSLAIRSSLRGTVGEDVWAIGCPMALGWTVANGIVSANREADMTGPNLIQHTVPTSPGSSGSPLLDSRGRVVGMVCSLMPGGQNVNFAVPGSDLEQLVLISDYFGRVDNGWLWLYATPKPARKDLVQHATTVISAVPFDGASAVAHKAAADIAYRIAAVVFDSLEHAASLKSATRQDEPTADFSGALDYAVSLDMTRTADCFARYSHGTNFLPAGSTDWEARLERVRDKCRKHPQTVTQLEWECLAIYEVAAAKTLNPNDLTSHGFLARALILLLRDADRTLGQASTANTSFRHIARWAAIENTIATEACGYSVVTGSDEMWLEDIVAKDSRDVFVGRDMDRLRGSALWPSDIDAKVKVMLAGTLNGPLAEIARQWYSFADTVRARMLQDSVDIDVCAATWFRMCEDQLCEQSAGRGSKFALFLIDRGSSGPARMPNAATVGYVTFAWTDDPWAKQWIRFWALAYPPGTGGSYYRSIEAAVTGRAPEGRGGN